MSDRFWERKSLGEMTEAEWESLCDRCGRCCLHRFEFESPELDRPVVVETDLGCKLLDCDSGTCLNYGQRKRHVPDCRKLTPQVVVESNWLPDTCAYRLVHERRPLRWWHPLISGDPKTVHEAGVSVRGYARPEAEIPNQDRYFQEWTNGLDLARVDHGHGPRAGGGLRRKLRKRRAG